MQPTLFRREAVEYKKQGLYGDVLILPKLSHTLILSALLLWFFFVFIWLFNSHYARKETVKGWLEPPAGIVRLYPETSGTIQKIFVNEGDIVQQDQPLMIIQAQAILGSGQQLSTELLREYESKRELVEDQLARTITIYDTRNKDTIKRISAARQESILYAQQFQTSQDHYQLISAQVERLKKLKGDGYVSRAEFDAAIGQELSLKSELQNLGRNQLAQQNVIEQLQTEQKLLPDQLANEIGQLKSRLSDIAQDMTQVSGQSLRVIKATRAGTVNNLQAREGQQVYLGGDVPLFTLIPNDSTLEAHFLIPVSSAGFLAVGQSVNIRYDAFPYQKFGIYNGKVEEISKTILLPNELLNVPVVIKEPVYRVTARLSQLTVQAYGKDFSLKPGMTLSADISLGDRNLVQWLLEPIYSLKGRI